MPGDSTRVAPVGKRSVSESPPVAPFRRNDRCTTESSAPPLRQRMASPDRNEAASGIAARLSARSPASQSKIPPQKAANASADTPPRNCQRQNPLATIVALLRGASVPTTTGLGAPVRPGLASSAVHVPLGASPPTSSGGRLSQPI